MKPPCFGRPAAREAAIPGAACGRFRLTRRPVRTERATRYASRTPVRCDSVGFSEIKSREAREGETPANLGLLA
jgi:hypothetical protein